MLGASHLQVSLKNSHDSLQQSMALAQAEAQALAGWTGCLPVVPFGALCAQFVDDDQWIYSGTYSAPNSNIGRIAKQVDEEGNTGDDGDGGLRRWSTSWARCGCACWSQMSSSHAHIHTYLRTHTHAHTLAATHTHKRTCLVLDHSIRLGFVQLVAAPSGGRLNEL